MRIESPSQRRSGNRGDSAHWRVRLADLLLALVSSLIASSSLKFLHRIRAGLRSPGPVPMMRSHPLVRVLRRLQTASPVAAPLIASLALHALLLIVLMSATWSAVGGPGGGYARTEVVINLPASQPASRPPAPAESGEIVRPAAIESALPRLQGLSTPTMTTLPTLRSAAGEAGATVSADLLRSQDDSFIGGATFAGLGTRQATSVVYVVDASGAMITSLQFVFAELERSVRNLSSGQKFQVVLFRDRQGASGPQYDIFIPPGMRPDRAQLVPATPANKAALSQWLRGIRPSGRSNPIDGLRRGLAFEPDAIFLLSRSIRRSGGELSAEPAGGVWGQPTEVTLAELDRLNPRGRLTGRRRVIIKAIQFLEEDPSGTMQAIGSEHGDGPGSYSVLTLQALGGR